MLSSTKDNVTDKENKVANGNHYNNTKNNVGLSSKRQLASINTPKKTLFPTTTKGSSQTPGPVLKNPILRDITNSANPSRLIPLNDISFPKRPSWPTSALKKRLENSKPIIESKLRITEPSTSPPKLSIEQILALPDNQLPDVEIVASPTTNRQHIDDHDDEHYFSDLPPIDDISQAQDHLLYFNNDAQKKDIVESLEKKKLSNNHLSAAHDLLDEAIKRLVLDPDEFKWAFEPIPENVEELERSRSHYQQQPCFMFDDIPDTCGLRPTATI